MDLKDRIVNALCDALDPEYVRLNDEDGISGFVVSRTFKGMTTLDRQGRIEEILQNAPLGQEERRQVLMIAGLTSEEYEAVGARIRVHGVREMARGVGEIMLHGGRSDAEYVRKAFNKQKGVETTDPKSVSGAIGVVMSFRAKGIEANPLTKEKALRILKKDQYIDVASPS